MRGNETFTIRPKLHEGESLLNYLIRVANKNGIVNISELWQSVKEGNSYKVDRNFVYKFDLYPSDIASLNKLGRLLNKSENELKQHSFEPIVSLFYPGPAGKMIFGKDIELKHRRFCRKCLEENGVYKLLWQVKEIEMCEKHLIRITSQCRNCRCHQPYRNRKHLDQIQCDDCGIILYDKKDKPLLDIDFIQKQLRIHRDWKFIFGDLIVKATHYYQNPQRIHNKIAILLLFLTTPQKGTINYKKHPFFKPSQARKLLNLTRNEIEDERLNLSLILNTLRKLNIELKDVFFQKIPFSFYKFLKKKKEKVKNKITINCESPWCSYYGTSNAMKDIRASSKGKYVPNSHLYNPIFVCTNCCVQIGFHKINKQWEGINISYKLLNEIKELFDSGLSLRQIGLRLKIDKYRVKYYLGHIARFQQDDIKDLAEKNINVETLIQNFILLKPYWRSHQLLAREAAKLFNWNGITTYYYYWHPAIQEYIFFEQNLRKTNQSIYQSLVHKMDKAIEHPIKSDMELSVKEVAATLNVSERILQYHKLNNEIINKRNSKVSLDKNEEKATIIESIAAFINVKKEREQQIFAYEIYKSIGKSPKYIKSHFPDIADQISNLAKESKSKQKEVRRKNLVKVIIEIHKEYGEVDMDLLSQNLDISVKTLRSGQGIYKGLGQLIRKTIAEFE